MPPSCAARRRRPVPARRSGSSPICAYASSLTTTAAGAGTAMDQLSAISGNSMRSSVRHRRAIPIPSRACRVRPRVFGRRHARSTAAVRAMPMRCAWSRSGSSAIGSLGADALTQSFMVENARANTDRIVDALAKLREENAALRRDPEPADAAASGMVILGRQALRRGKLGGTRSAASTCRVCPLRPLSRGWGVLWFGWRRSRRR